MNDSVQITIPTRLRLYASNFSIVDGAEVERAKKDFEIKLRAITLQSATALLVEAFLRLPTLLEIEAVVEADSAFDDDSFFTAYSLTLRGKFSKYPDEQTRLWGCDIYPQDFTNDPQECDPSRWVLLRDFGQRLDEDGLDGRWIDMAHAAVPNDSHPVARASLARNRIEALLKEPVIDLLAVYQQTRFSEG